MNATIQAAGIRKRYGTREALRGVDLAVPAGQVLGVLGPHGAGKTTTVRILTTLMRPDAGYASVAGFDVLRQPDEVRKRIGFAGPPWATEGWMTGREYLTRIGARRRLGPRQVRLRTAELLDRLELTEVANRHTRTYSGATRSRLDLAARLLTDPVALVLDEPATGLSERGRRELWRMLREQAAGGVTVLLATRNLAEADRLADRIVVVDTGRVIAEGTPGELKHKVGGDWLEVAVESTVDVPVVVAALARTASAVPRIGENGRTISVPLPCGVLSVPTVSIALNQTMAPITALSVRRPSLADVFHSLTGPNAPGGVEHVQAAWRCAALPPQQLPFPAAGEPTVLYEKRTGGAPAAERQEHSSGPC